LTILSAERWDLFENADAAELSYSYLATPQ